MYLTNEHNVKEKNKIKVKELVTNWFPLFIVAGFVVFMLVIPFVKVLPINGPQQQHWEIFLVFFGYACIAYSYWRRKGSIEEKIKGVGTKITGEISGAVTGKGDFKGELKGESIGRGNNGRNTPLVIFAGIYTIVNGLGITRGLEIYVADINNKLGNLTAKTFTGLLEIGRMETTRLFCLFITQIPFLHGALIALSSDISEFRKQYLPFLIFVALLVHAALFFFIGSNLQHLPQFTFLLWILFTFNVIWLTSLRKLIPKDLIIPEWIQLNAITSAFLFSYYFPYPFLLNNSYRLLDDDMSNYVLLAVLTIRTLLDYGCGWREFYKQDLFKKPAANSDSSN